MKTKVIIIVTVSVFVLVFAILFTYSAITSLATIKNNAEGFRSNIISISKDVPIDLQKLTPFEWDEVYFFDPYVSKEQIFKTIGFRWDGVKQQVSEGMMQILFVYKGKVVCYCSGYGTDNGYFVDGNIIGNSRTLKKSDDLMFTFDNELSKRLNYIYLKYSSQD